MSVSCYLVEIVDYGPDEFGVYRFKEFHSGVEIANLWENDWISNIASDYGVNALNSDGIGFLELDICAIEMFEESTSFDRLSDYQKQIFFKLKECIEKSKFQFVKLDCW